MSSRCPTAACPRRSASARQSGIPFELGIIRSHYVGRTFIQPNDGPPPRRQAQAQRQSALIHGKRIVLIDDSIVRGTTSVKIVQMMRDAGAARSAYADRLAADAAQLLLRRRHARALEAARRATWMSRRCATSSTPTAWPSSPSTASIARLATSATATQPQRCDACFTGDYPTTLTDCDPGERAPRRSRAGRSSASASVAH